MSHSPLKRCAKCKEEKPLRDFWRKTESRDGLDSRCKACILAIQRKQRRQRNPYQEDRAYVRGMCCGVCFKRLRRPRNYGGWLCEEHAPKGIGSTSHCSKCPQLQECYQRVHLGLWAFCERPTKADILRARVQGVECDDQGKEVHIPATLLQKVAVPEDWKILEASFG